jgi:phosphatidylglycerol:prolipoprotein diacylglycerol transferase
MRPRIIDYLNHISGSGIFGYLIPDPAVIYAITLGLGLLLFIRRCNSRELEFRHSSGMALWAVLSGMIGARLFFLIQNIGMVIENPSILYEINGATVSFGAYLGGIAGFTGYCIVRKIPPWNYLDTAASALGIGPMIGRLACFLNGDDYGTLSNVAWAVRYPHGSYPFMDQVASGKLDPMSDLSLPVHPVQLYCCIKGLLLLVLFTYLWNKQLFRPGVLFFLFFMSYSVCRFFLEFFRGDEDRGWVGPISTGQFMSLIIILISVAGIILIGRKKYKTVAVS